MTTLDTLCVRLEAEAGSLFQDLDTLEHRLTALRGQSGQRVSLPAELEMRLSVTADEAIAGALRGAGDTLSAAVQGHDVQLGGALAEAQQAMPAWAGARAITPPPTPTWAMPPAARRARTSRWRIPTPWPLSPITAAAAWPPIGWARAAWTRREA